MNRIEKYRKVYKNSDEEKPYLKARFLNRSSSVFSWDNHMYKYRYTDFDDNGEFDLLVYHPISTEDKTLIKMGNYSFIE